MSKDITEIERIDIAEFQELGYLQEVNRLFFHPLGLALEIVIDDHGERLGGIWDSREDDEGFYFGKDMIDKDKSRFVLREFEKRKYARIKLFGDMVQDI